jgi:hypothetical protein
MWPAVEVVTDGQQLRRECTLPRAAEHASRNSCSSHISLGLGGGGGAARTERDSPLHGLNGLNGTTAEPRTFHTSSFHRVLPPVCYSPFRARIQPRL